MAGFFLGLEDEQAAALRYHIGAKGIPATRFHWGQPTLVVRDLDANELFFWLSPGAWATLDSELAEQGT